MRKILLFAAFLLCMAGCTKDKETMIKGHLIEGSTGESLANVKVTLYDDTKVYAIVFSDASGMFSMATPTLVENHYYKLSFYWSEEYPAKEITVVNAPEIFDLKDFVVYDKTNPYDYLIYDGYMIHKTLDGFYTYEEAKAACQSLRDGYDDWMLPETDYLDVLADDENLANQIAEDDWYWTSWVNNYGTNVYYYHCINILMNESAITTNPNEKLKVLPVRRIQQ